MEAPVPRCSNKNCRHTEFRKGPGPKKIGVRNYKYTIVRRCMRCNKVQ